MDWTEADALPAPTVLERLHSEVIIAAREHGPSGVVVVELLSPEWVALLADSKLLRYASKSLGLSALALQLNWEVVALHSDVSRVTCFPTRRR